ncbi:hypothetical protein GALL_489630 [mine drainage metagenome]|uniref:Uncharacterized protein n=1 Tax=mine drainage metagenome TaxID=410659 RepID=A0A1J5PVV5_9ZZZZ
MGHLEDAGVPTRAALEALAEVGAEELGDGIPAAEPGHRQTAVGHGVGLGEGDEGLHEDAEFLGLHEGGLDALTVDERGGEILHEGLALVGGAAQALAGNVVTHGGSLHFLLEAHTQGEADAGQFVLDLLEGFLAEILGLHQLGLGPLNQLADGGDVRVPQAVVGPDG